MAESQLTLPFLRVKSSRRPYDGAANPNWKGGPLDKACARCGARFRVKCANRKARFCNLECFNLWQKETSAGKGRPKKPKAEVSCLWCGKVFFVQPSWVGRKKFCRRKCHLAWRSERMALDGNPRWEGGISRLPYAPEWPKARRATIRRDGRLCLNPLCKGGSTRIVVHHIDYDKSNCDLANLIVVCDVCNSRANSRRKWWMAHYQAIQRGRSLCPAGREAILPAVPDTPGRKGSKHHAAKITEADVASILTLKSEGVRNRRIAERYGVSEATISNIVRGKSWTHVINGVE